jgi:predicted hydrocarbon binding protein
MSEPVVVGKVSAALPLSLLESVRAHDRPDEFLEDEDLMLSMPRRLGLTGVVDNQIRHYQAAGRTGVSLEELTNLIRLVLKRDDASMILRETGRRMAEQHYEHLSQGLVRMARLLPGGILARSWRRSASRLMKQMVGDASAVVSGRPPTVRLQPNPLALLEPVGTACALYGSGLERLAELFTGETASASQTHCCAYGESYCQWSIHGL